jgi:hypothetical protein
VRLELRIIFNPYIQEILDVTRLLNATLDLRFFTTVTLADSSLAKAVCDVNACISYCQKSGPQAGLGNYCSRNCLITVDGNKKKGLCK